ncbi:MAG: transcriptional repressor [Candidatus Woesearchaeota archaeon]|jgi:Fe2+ or Zn2+ uptake regulation protein|nr:transcriptional repressor [Candidatus Woesearchaeota archaeon]MDP7622871.1 transcriptional repressor [Candidatus Woesearchaeota archaeon]HJN56869.1 transcriptional repressor [Candidatus Woesearchaeota archaeon]|tara:strand:- start:18125 stop:18529 length:405 start_codon:yes stop_codon:yes gene_type:complete
METITGLKLTNQRHEILDYLDNNKVHPTADRIYFEVRKKLPRISRGTVYRNLEVLSQKGFVKEVNAAGTKKFELGVKSGMQSHDHFICRKCNKMVDVFFSDMDNRVLKQIKNKDHSLKVESMTINFSGLCNKCK